MRGKKRGKRRGLWLVIFLALIIGACSKGLGTEETGTTSVASTVESRTGESVVSSVTEEASETSSQLPEESTISEPSELPEPEITLFSLTDVPAYTGSAAVEICNNVPGFTEEEYSATAFESYSELDELGRCGVAYACVGEETMPTEERGAIGMVKPSGWHTVKYAIVDGNYLYNRCHLIAYQLSGENANTQNLITGTRYMNTEGMLPYEEQVADYIHSTGNHVLYRVTPVFEGDNLVASGVEMEAASLEDKGATLSFHVYCYNVQPGISIDYATGDSALEEGSTQETETSETSQVAAAEPQETVESVAAETTSVDTADYVLNTNTKKFHYPSCASVKKMKSKNRKDYTGTREEIINKGYDPCKNCNP